MAFNPTTNRVPWGLLEQHERDALKRWPHGWEWYDEGPGWVGWAEIDRPSWLVRTIYRGRPAPANKEDVR